MPATREMLEGEAYWGRIRSIKMKLYIIEGVLFTLLGVMLVFFSGGFQMSPFHLPLDRIVWFILVVLLIIEIESFAFRIMQIRMARTFSTKHLMTINSIRKSIIIIIVATIAVIAFATPAIIHGVEDSFPTAGTMNSSEPLQFLSEDQIGFSRVDVIALATDYEAQVLLVTDSVYNGNVGDWQALRQSALVVKALNESGGAIEVPPIGYRYLYLLVDPLNSQLGENANVHFSLGREFSGTFTGFIPLMGVAFIVTNCVWLSYVWPLGKKYSSKSIYK